MRRFLTYVLCSVLLGFSISMPAQNLPALQKDGTITTGALSNGISFYLVTNSTMKGVADFALVRKGMTDSLAARSELSSLPHFNKTVPYKFLSRKGIGCRPDGYISYVEDATLFRFDDVPMFDVAASDTTLLMLFDIIAAKPCPHAVVISGDINPAAIIEKMKVFSLMVPSRTTSYQPKAYSWTPAEETDYSFVPSPVASVEVDFRSPRTPADQMNTIQPFISKLFSLELADLVKYRLRESLVSRDIPVRSISVRNIGSGESSGDEHFVVKVEMAEDQLIPATMALSSTLAELGTKPIGKDEYRSYRERVLKSLAKSPTNEEMVLQCVSNYLFGGDLTTSPTKVKYFTSKNMSVESEAALFNNYTSALLGDTDDATVRWPGSSDEYDEWTYQMVFKSTWNVVAMLDKPTYYWTVSARDTSTFGADKGKTKLKNIAAEPMSGGDMWTFANGMRVIYKKMATGGKFCYSMMIKGGFSTVRDLPWGEGAFFSDMMGLHRIAGLSPGSFEKVLRANGIDFQTKVSASDMRICGSAPSNHYALVVKALLSVANERKMDLSGFEAYRKMEISMMDRSPLDSLMYPENNYTEVKAPAGLAPTTLSDAEAYFSKEFLRCSDGVIVFVGDLPVETVQKYLAKTIGGFRISKSVTPRSVASLNLRAGTTTFTGNGDTPGVSIGIAGAYPFSTENSMAFKSACLSLARRLSGEMAQLGYHVRMDNRFFTFPREVADVRLTLTPVPESGLPEGVEVGTEPEKVLIAARKTIDEVLSGPISGPELASCKALLANDYSISLADPANYADAILMRYSSGKDVLTSYNEKINGISADKIKEVFSALAGGMRVEYVVKPNE